MLEQPALNYEANQDRGEELTFAELRTMHYKAPEADKSKLLARMERAATTEEELMIVKNYVRPHSALDEIVDRRIEALHHVN